jgi:hypothetical protein
MLGISILHIVSVRSQYSFPLLESSQMKRSSDLKPIPKPDVKVEVDIKDVGGRVGTRSKQ